MWFFPFVPFLLAILRLWAPLHIVRHPNLLVLVFLENGKQNHCKTRISSQSAPKILANWANNCYKTGENKNTANGNTASENWTRAKSHKKSAHSSRQCSCLPLAPKFPSTKKQLNFHLQCYHLQCFIFARYKTGEKTLKGQMVPFSRAHLPAPQKKIRTQTRTPSPTPTRARTRTRTRTRARTLWFEVRLEVRRGT